jgi:hypothetical protein
LCLVVFFSVQVCFFSITVSNAMCLWVNLVKCENLMFLKRVGNGVKSALTLSHFLSPLVCFVVFLFVCFLFACL